MISMQSIMLEYLQYSYCAATFVVFKMCDEAKESLAIVLTTSRCHFDEMVTAHRNQVMISFCQRSYSSFARPADSFLSLGPLIQVTDWFSRNLIGYKVGRVTQYGLHFHCYRNHRLQCTLGVIDAALN